MEASARTTSSSKAPASVALARLPARPTQVCLYLFFEFETFATAAHIETKPMELRLTGIFSRHRFRRSSQHRLWSHSKHWRRTLRCKYWWRIREHWRYVLAAHSHFDAYDSMRFVALQGCLSSISVLISSSRLLINNQHGSKFWFPLIYYKTWAAQII